MKTIKGNLAALFVIASLAVNAQSVAVNFKSRGPLSLQGRDDDMTFVQSPKDVKPIIFNLATAFIAHEFIEGNKDALMITNPLPKPGPVNNYFAVERRNDTTGFTQVGVVNTVANTGKKHNYTFIDDRSTDEISYYRLGQIDEENTTPVTDVKWVRLLDVNDILVYPDFDGEKLNIKLNIRSSCSIGIAGMDAKEYFRRNYWKDNDTIKLDISNLPAGFYFININNGNSSYRVQFFKRGI